MRFQCITTVLLFAGVLQASSIGPSYGSLSVSASSPDKPAVYSATSVYSAELIVIDGPEFALIILSGEIAGNLADSRLRSGGVASFSTLLGDRHSEPGDNYLPSPACTDIRCGGGGFFQPISYPYQRGMSFPFSITLRATSYFGGRADAEVFYRLRFAEVSPITGGSRTIEGPHVQIASPNPEPGTWMMMAGGVLLAGLRCARARRKSY